MQDDDPAQHAAETVAEETFGSGATAQKEPVTAGKKAVAQYDYEKAEENEIELKEGETVTDIDMVDADWWMGKNARGEMGLFPSNYVEVVGEDGGESGGGLRGDGAVGSAGGGGLQEGGAVGSAGGGGGGGAGGSTATAMYDYEAAEENELSFPDGAKITDVVSLNVLLLFSVSQCFTLSRYNTVPSSCMYLVLSVT